MNLFRVAARTTAARTARSAGAPWIVGRWLSVLLVPFRGRRV